MTLISRASPARHRAAPPGPASNTTVLALAALLVFVVPAQLAFGTAGLSFRVPSVVGLLGLLLGGCRLLLVRGPGGTRWNAVVVVLVAYGSYALLQYGRAQFVPSGSNSGAPIRSLLLSLGAVGLGLLAALSLDDRRKLRTVLVWLCSGAYLSAVVALGQKLFDMPYASLWRGVPGLQTDNLGSRTVNVLSGRAFGTAGHPIELSVVSVAMLAFALHLASHHPTRGGRQYHAVGSVLLLFAGFLAISRSGFIALLVVLAVRFAYSAARQRLNLAVVLVVGVAVTEVLSPRTLSTLRYQLGHIGTDDSSRGRTSDYGPVLAQWHDHLLLGTGFGVPSAANNRILDNAWLGLLANGGLAAVVLLAALFLVTIGRAAVWAHAASRDGRDPELHSIASAAVAATTALMIAAYFFDELSFYQAQTLVFLIPGIVGAAPYGGLLVGSAVDDADPLDVVAPTRSQGNLAPAAVASADVEASWWPFEPPSPDPIARDTT